MKIVIFLNGDRGLSVLTELLTISRFQIIAIVTPQSFKEDQLAFCKDIPLHKSKNVNTLDTLEYLKSVNADIFLIAGYSDIFKKDILKIPPRGILNLHAGRLPEYRGGSPLNWQIINGEKEAGLSVIMIDEGVDTGDIVTQSKIPINRDHTIKDLHEAANQIFPKLTIEALDSVKDNKATLPQDESRACYWHQRDDLDGFLNFEEMTAIQVHNKVRAITSPYPGAWAYRQKDKIRILSCEISSIKINGTAGKVCFVGNSNPLVICKEGAIMLKSYSFEHLNDTLKRGNLLLSKPYTNEN